MSYNASGNKVVQDDPWVGLGWSLNAGGVVTRVVKGNPDMKFNYFNQVAAVEPFDGTPIPVTGRIAEQQFLNRVKDGFIETQSDMYFFNFAGFSGKFYIKNNRDIYILDNNDFKIEFVLGAVDITSFTITDNKGFKYTFMATETSTLNLSDALSGRQQLARAQYIFNSAWFLTEISHPLTNDKIRLSYTNSADLYSPPVNHYTNSFVHYTQVNPRQSPSNELQRVEESKEIESVIIQRTFLSTIQYYIGEQLVESVSFNVADTNGEELSSITVSSDQSTITRTFQLNYTHSNRRRLISLQEIGQNSVSKQHFFEYDSQELPPITSYDIDHWGYYNHNGTSSLVPSMMDGTVLRGGGANREPNEFRMKAGILTKMVYPTGGYTQFTYEGHRGVHNELIGGLRVTEIADYDHDNTLITKKRLQYTKENGESSGILFTVPRYNTFSSYYECGQANEGGTGTPSSMTTSSTFHANNIGELGSSSGSHIGYSRVVEQVISNQNASITNGKTVYHYHNEPVSEIAEHSNNGTLLETEMYDIQSRLVQKKTFTYEYFQKKVLRILKSQALENQDSKVMLMPDGNWLSPPGKICCFFIGDRCGVPPGSAIFDAKLQRRYSYAYEYSKYLLHTTETLYFYDTQNQISTLSTTTAYRYNDNRLHLAPIETQVTGSDGLIRTTLSYYPTECTQSLIYPDVAKAEVLIRQNRLSEALKIESYSGLRTAPRTHFIGGYRILLDDFSRLKHFQMIYPNHSIQTVETIEEYNSEHLPLRMTSIGYTISKMFTWDARNRLTNQSWGALNWQYGYHPTTGLLQQMIDENGIRQTFEYDGFQRLRRVNGKLDANGEHPQTWAETDYFYRGHQGRLQNEIISTIHFANLNLGNSLISHHSMATHQFFDGLGRATQTVKSLQDGTFAKNFVQYDVFGRKERTFQAFQQLSQDYAPINGMAYASNPHVQTVYEASPLSRPIQQIFENGTSVSTSYGTNAANEVLLYRNGVWNNEYYSANELFKTVVTDENGKSTTVFKDKMGRVVLTRKVLDNSNVDTYNLYNDLGQWIAVLPPGCTTMESPLSFRYEYDSKNRLSRKRVPGADWQEFYYDNRDLLALTQDGNTRTINPNQYLATQYDELGRAIKTGWVYGPDKAEAALHTLQIAEMDALTKVTYEPNRSYVSKTETRVLEGQQLTGWLTNEVTSRDEWGKPTGIRQTHLEGEDNLYMEYNSADKPLRINRKHQGLNGATEVITQRFSYDAQLRPRETSQKFDGGIVQGLDEMVLSQMNYNFKDQLMEKNIGKNVDRNGRFLQSIDYLYNVRGWLTAINGLDLTATNSDVKKIPMVKKGMNSMIDLLEMDDTYTSTAAAGNTNENPDLFSQVLNYEAPVSGLHATAQYNGNISSTIWQVAGREMQGYGYKYDDLNRLTEAYYADLQETYNNYTWNRRNVTFSTDNSYKENMQYDVRGNITSLQRNGLKINGFTGGNYVAGDFGAIDDLHYEYNDRNQVVRIQDNAVTIDPNAPHAEKDFKGFVYKYDAISNEHYRYDANGNLIYDAHKDIETIEYNYLNLPAKITFTNNRTITFMYDATGKKLRKTVTGNGQTEQRDYLDGIEYKDGKPDEFLHSEGSVHMDKDGQFKYYFVLRDHLGNTRVTFSDLNNDDEINEKEEIIQINNYYAFGLNMEGNWNGANGANKYQYNGKEWNDDFGLGWNDYGARFYDPAMARWQTVDPLSEKMRRHSPYNYGFDNPMRFIDPDGMQSESVHVDDRGNVLKNYDDGDNTVYLHEGKKTAKDVESAYWSTKGTSAGGKNIGNLGGGIDISVIAQNLLNDHKVEALTMYQPDWVVKVLPKGDWDYKNNTNTIFGVAWAFDEAAKKAGKTSWTTGFNDGVHQFNSAADFGNYHAGYIGTVIGIARETQYRWAGLGEIAKMPEDLRVRLKQVIAGIPPHGDRNVDYWWNTQGMNEAKPIPPLLRKYTLLLRSIIKK